MLWSILMVILGIALSVSNANQWFIVPEFCVNICFGVAGLLLIVALINWLIAQGRAKKIQDRIGRW